MTFTRINLNQIQGITETSDGKINIEKNINFTEQISIPLIPPSQDSDGVIWVEPTTGNFKNRINLVNYAPSFKGDFKDISFGSPDTISLGGNTGIINNLVVSGTNTVLNIRSNAFGTAQWSVLEVQGNLTVASGCTVNLIRTPLIVRGNILGSGIITSPNGTNGQGTGGVGGPGGIGGLRGIANAFGFNPALNGGSGGNSIENWPNKNSSSGLLIETEYGVFSGDGGSGGRGSAGGGGGGAYGGAFTLTGRPPYNEPYTTYYTGAGGDSGNGFTRVFANLANSSTGGGGAGGPGNGITGGPGAWGTPGNVGNSGGNLIIPYIGLGTSSLGTSGPTQGTPGGATFGGAGGPGVTGPTQANSALINGNPGSPGGSGGNGGAGGGTGGAHISILCAGTVSSSLTIRPGKGGLTGGSTSLPRAQTGSLWLFTLNNDPINTDITGANGTPNGPNGVLNRTLISNTSGVTDFFTNILFEPNGLTPAKTKFAVTNS